MTASVLVLLVLLAGAGLLLLHVLREGRKLDERDPRLGQIVYEDVEKPGLGLAEVEEAGDAEAERVPYLYLVDNEFAVDPDGSGRRVRLVLQGKADRIVRKRSGALHIIDYKSGTSGKDPDKTEHYKFQLVAYFSMVEQSLGEKPAKAIIDYVDGVADWVEIENTDEIREECRQLLREICALKLGEIPDELLARLDEPSTPAAADRRGRPR